MDYSNNDGEWQKTRGDNGAMKDQRPGTGRHDEHCDPNRSGRRDNDQDLRPNHRNQNGSGGPSQPKYGDGREVRNGRRDDDNELASAISKLSVGSSERNPASRLEWEPKRERCPQQSNGGQSRGRAIGELSENEIYRCLAERGIKSPQKIHNSVKRNPQGMAAALSRALGNCESTT